MLDCPSTRLPSIQPASTQPAYARLNLRHNPFGELDDRVRSQVAVVDIRGYVEQLRQPGVALQFLGPPGRGKTTHLLALAAAFPRAGYVRIPEGGRPPTATGFPLLIDEAQRLSRWRRWRVLRPPGSFALASHLDLSRELRRAGLKVDSVRLGERPAAGHLQRMLDRRIDHARRGPGRVPRISQVTAEALIDRFGADIRSIEWHLYDVFQQLETIDYV